MSWPGLEKWGACMECGRRGLLRFTGATYICPLCWERIFGNGTEDKT